MNINISATKNEAINYFTRELRWHSGIQAVNQSSYKINLGFIYIRKNVTLFLDYHKDFWSKNNDFRNAHNLFHTPGAQEKICHIPGIVTFKNKFLLHSLIWSFTGSQWFLPSQYYLFHNDNIFAGIVTSALQWHKNSRQLEILELCCQLEIRPQGYRFRDSLAEVRRRTDWRLRWDAQEIWRWDRLIK